MVNNDPKRDDAMNKLWRHKNKNILSLDVTIDVAGIKILEIGRKFWMEVKFLNSVVALHIHWVVASCENALMQAFAT